MHLVVTPTGEVRGLYTEDLDLTALGLPRITRASHVEPGADALWYADLTPVRGPILGPFRHRSEALQAEVQWLEDHWLTAELSFSSISQVCAGYR